MTAKHGGPRNYPKHRRIHRIVELLQKRRYPMGARELAAELHASHEAITACIRRVRAGMEGFPHIRIADWKAPVPGSGAHTPMYQLGDAPDAVKVRIGRHGPRTTPRFNPNATRDALLMLLATNKAMTVDELCMTLERSESAIGRILGKLRHGVVPLARVRVTGFEFTRTNKPALRWTIGNAYDIKYKAQTQEEKTRRYREKHGALINARLRKRRAGTVATPFDWLIKQAA